MFKKYILIFIALSAIHATNKIYTNNFNSFELVSINSNIIEVDIAIGEINFNSININEEEYIQLTIPSSYPSRVVGTPDLPMFNKLIEIPREATIRIEIINDNFITYSLSEYNISGNIAPVQNSIPKSGTILPSLINHNIYNDNNFFKKELVKIEEKGFLREVKIGNLMISPIEYNPIENKIIVHDKIKFRIHFDNANIDLTNEKKLFSYSPYFEPIYANLIDNYSPPTETRENDFIEDVVSYIIIADQSFSNSLEPFIEWKQKKGFHITIAYTNEIGSSSNAIKNYLQDQYNNPGGNMPLPTFVLLVGDTPQIPASYSSGGHVSDLDYCDYTNDNLPDVLCGRFSAQSAMHVMTQVNKTLEYEKYTMPDPSFLSEVMLISGVDASYAPTYGNGQINYGTSYYFNNNNGITSNTFLYPASGSSGSQILSIASQGVAFINYTAHGWESGWADPEFDVNDVNNMSNINKYPTMVGNCCLTNAFDSGECFGEALLRKSNAGAIGYIGGSDVTYWNEDYWWGVGSGSINSNPNYNSTGAGAYDGMFHLEDEENWAIVNSAIIIAGNLAVVEANGMDDYYWEIYHLMGDPSLSTYQGIPTENNVNHDIFLPIGTEAIEIEADPFSYVGLSQNGNLLSGGTVNESGFIVLVFNSISDPGTIDITVTGQNKIPYFNEIFVASPDGAYTTISSDEINSGNDDIISINEVINIEISLENVGTEVANNIQLTLSNPNSDPYINLVDDSVTIPNLGVGETISTNLSFSISSNSPYGHSFNILASMDSNESTWESLYALEVEPLVESFESNSFDEFLWESSGDENWVIDSLVSYEGSNSAKSGTIDHNMTSEVSIMVEVVEDGEIRFNKKVSCEDVGSYSGNYYDYLAFYIDGVEQNKWAGELDWSQHSYSVTAGEHTFLWKYSKDQGIVGGQDAAWIDSIIFPPSYYSSVMLGDVNGDSMINIQDVILTVNIILDAMGYNEAADLNADGIINVIDVINIVNLILG